MKTGIWQLTAMSLLWMSIGAQALAGDQSPRDQLRGSGAEGSQQRQIQQQQNQQQMQQQMQQRSAERQQQQQINQQQREQQRQIQTQQDQMRQVERDQQQQIQQQQMQQRNVERQQQQQINQQQREQQRQIQEQQNQQRQAERQQLRQAQDNLPIQSGPREAWQTQPPRQGYYHDIPRGNRNWQTGRPNDHWDGRPDGHGNGWGPGPQYRPGHAIDRVPGGYSRIPYRGQDYFYADGYWYRPQGQRYIVVTPPYGARVRSLPSYSREVWVGSSLLFLAAGTYYTYQPNTEEYVVVTPPQNEPAYANPQQGNGYDPVAYPQNGQSPQQVELDHYQCYRWAADESGFDPANVTYQPAPEVVDRYRRSMGACLVERGYSVQ
ncbi:hypothetical protein J3P77_03250 [Pseudomonas sp. R1-18]|uniref:DUF6515 family protein n=1 Tax=Pseudomonas sp. R1-18 TaxID=1632772 RepID=UPI003DA98FEE